MICAAPVHVLANVVVLQPAVDLRGVGRLSLVLELRAKLLLLLIVAIIVDSRFKIIFLSA